MSKRLLSLTLIPALSLLLLANRSVRDSYDLKPQVEAGQKLAFNFEMSGTFELADAEITIGPDTLPEAPIVDVEFSMSHGADVEILTAKDGEAQSARLKITDDANSFSGEASMMGTSQTFGETGEAKMLGHTILIEKDEEGEITVSDVSDEEGLEPLSDEDMDGFDLENHFSVILPEGPVAVGESWDIGERALKLIRDGMKKDGGTSESDAEEFEKVMSLLSSSSEVEFTGTLQSVEGTSANIVWSATFTLDQLDLLNFAREMGAGAELDEMPVQDLEMLGSSSVELSGKGVFDLEAHQLTSFSLEGEYTFDLEGSASAEGMEFQMSSEFEGTLEMSGGTTPE